MYVCDSKFSKYLEKTASIVVWYFVVDCAGSLFILKLNLSSRNFFSDSDFSSWKFTLKSPAKISGSSLPKYLNSCVLWNTQPKLEEGTLEYRAFFD